MSEFGAYVRGVLAQIRAAYDTLEGLEDGPGEIDVIRREWLRAAALLRSLSARIIQSGEAASAYAELAELCGRYADRYYFDREMDAISALYADDAHRTRNIRLKILESFREERLIERLDEAMAGIK